MGLETLLAGLAAAPLIDRALGFGINSGALTIAYPFITTKPNKDVIKQYTNLPKDLTSLDYFNLANSIVQNHSSKKNPVCRHTGISTFKTYQQLIKQNDRRDLKDEIRIALGHDKIWTHLYLEANVEDSWVPYETTQYTPELEVQNIKRYTQESFEDKKKINLDTGWKKDLHSLKGTPFYLPSKENIRNCRGIVPELYSMIKGAFNVFVLNGDESMGIVPLKDKIRQRLSGIKDNIVQQPLIEHTHDSYHDLPIDHSFLNNEIQPTGTVEVIKLNGERVIYTSPSITIGD